MALWTLHNGGVLEPGAVVAPHERLGWGKTIGLGAQHVVAMFGATFVFPILMGLNPQLAVMMSGVATLLAMVSGLAPARLALTEITGKSTSGSGDTGSASTSSMRP